MNSGANSIITSTTISSLTSTVISTTTTGECTPNDIDLDSLDQPGKYILTATISLMAVIIALGSVGNALVIAAVLHQTKLRTVPNIFVVNLSMCDLVFVTTVLPVNVYTYLTNDWRFDMALCSFIGFLSYTLTGTTILTITLIAWNRYKMVVDNSTTKQLFSRRNITAMLVSTWIIPAALLQVAVFNQWGHFGYIPMLSTCNLALDQASQSFKVFLLVIRAAIPSGLIIYFYTAIYATTIASHRRLTRHDNDKDTERHQNNLQQEMRLTRMMVCIFLVFVLSYFPCTVSSVIDWNRMLSKTFHLFCQTSVFLGSAINPMIYGFMNKRFRKAYFEIITCTFLKKRYQRRLRIGDLRPIISQRENTKKSTMSASVGILASKTTMMSHVGSSPSITKVDTLTKDNDQ